MLCLICLDENTELTKYGYPVGKTSFGTGKRLFICDVLSIGCAVGVLKSPIQQNKYYYVYKNMMNNPIILGNTQKI